MKFSVGVSLLAFILCATLAKSDLSTSLSEVKMQQTLMNYLLTPNALAASSDPEATAACFTQYLPILQQIGSTFSTQYQTCLTVADEQTANLTAEAAATRDDFIQQVQTVCNAYTTCNSDTQILAFFDCYASVSSQDVSLIYDLSTNATSSAATLSQSLKVIENEKNVCTNTTEQTYIQNTAATYKLLDSCLEAAGASTIPPVTFAPTNNAIVLNAFVEQKNCSTNNDTRTRTSADGSQTQTQTGSGCQSQNSGNGTQSQNQSSGNSTQSQSQNSINGTQSQSQSSGNGTESQSQSSGSGSQNQTQSSGNGSQSQSQSGSGSQTQSQCSGSDCGDFKPFPPLFTMAPMEPWH